MPSNTTSALNIEAARLYCFQDHPGWLINIGAGDPWPASSFYDAGWQCLLIEPDPQMIHQLYSHGGRRNDPRWQVCSVAMADNPGILPFFIGHPLTSSLDPDWHKKVVVQDDQATILVRCTTSNELISFFPKYFEHPMETAVIMDVEGYDHRLLDAWPFDRFAPAMLVAESPGYYTSPKIESMYRLHMNDGLNLIWIRKDLKPWRT